MKFHPAYSSLLKCNTPDKVFQYFTDSINASNTTWDYFVNWGKVNSNLSDIEIDLNTMNYLVGKSDIEQAFKDLLKRDGKLARLIPILLACRDHDFTIVTEISSGNVKHEHFSFTNKSQLTNEEIEKAFQFASNTGILDLFKNKTIKNATDYVFGVEVGLDSNGRKNRGGTAMEGIVKNILLPICDKLQYQIIDQATPRLIKKQWNIDIQVDKSSRIFDFAVKKGQSICFIETNYYNGGGSKLKATAGEYKALFDFLSSNGHEFIWITDGEGWKSTLHPLRETFNHIKYLVNLNMARSGLLETLLKDIL